MESHMLGYSPHAAFREAGKWQYIGCPIAKFGEEPHQGFRNLIRPDHQSAHCASQSILGNHPLTRLDVAEMEVFACLLDQIPAFDHDCIEHGVGGRLDIDRDDTIRSNQGKLPLRVRLVGLDAIGQSDSDEFGVVSISAEFRDCILCK
jgi:hypothetical protein